MVTFLDAVVLNRQLSGIQENLVDLSPDHTRGFFLKQKLPTTDIWEVDGSHFNYHSHKDHSPTHETLI